MLRERSKNSRAAKPRKRALLAVEALEDRCLLDAAPALAQFGTADAFVQYLRDTALTRYHDLFGQHVASYVYYGLGQRFVYTTQAAAGSVTTTVVDKAVPQEFTGAQQALTQSANPTQVGEDPSHSGTN